MIVSMLAFSCELDEPVYDLRTDETLTYSPESTDAFLASLWTGMTKRYAYYQAQFPNFLFMHAFQIVRQNGYVPFADKIQTPADAQCRNYWDQIYSAIANCNLVLDLLPETPETELDSNAVGLARIHRALHYCHLARMFGGVPLVKSTEDIFLPRATLDETLQFVVDDLELAYTYLAETQTRKENPKKMAAMAMQAWAYHHRASFSGDAEHWTKARDAARTVIESGVYSLLPDFAHLWDLNHEFSSESIFEVPFSRNGSNNGTYNPAMMAPYGSKYLYTSQNPRSFFYIGRDLIDTLLGTYGGEPDYRMRVSTNTGQVYDWMITRPGGAPTQVAAAYPYTLENFRDAGASHYHSQIHVKKWQDPMASSPTGHECNMIPLRLAEIYLIAAEAECEINGGPNAAAVDYLNVILTRARNGEKFAEPRNVRVEDFAGREAFINRILLERANEFIAENLNIWWDERRFGTDHLREVIRRHNAQYDLERKPEWQALYGAPYPRDKRHQEDDAFVLKNMLLPIPTSEINTNPNISEADQNPGY
jgi:hypothetical protein